MKVLSIYDSCAKTFLPPWYKPSVPEGVRDFRLLVLDPNSVVSKSPEDYVLFTLGTFDSDNGSFELLPAPERVISALQLSSVE